MSQDATKQVGVKHHHWKELGAIDFGFVPLNAGTEGFYALEDRSAGTTETEALRIIQRRLAETDTRDNRGSK